MASYASLAEEFVQGSVHPPIHLSVHPSDGKLSRQLGGDSWERNHVRCRGDPPSRLDANNTGRVKSFRDPSTTNAPPATTVANPGEILRLLPRRRHPAKNGEKSDLQLNKEAAKVVRPLWDGSASVSSAQEIAPSCSPSFLPRPSWLLDMSTDGGQRGQQTDRQTCVRLRAPRPTLF